MEERKAANPGHQNGILYNEDKVKTDGPHPSMSSNIIPAIRRLSKCYQCAWFAHMISSTLAH